MEKLPQLEELSIYTGDDADLSVLDGLANLKKVDFLDLCYILPQELVRLREVEDLTVAVKEAECLQILGGFEKLERLKLHMAIHEYETPVDVSALAGITGLKRLSMDNFWGGEFVGVEKILNLQGLVEFRLDQGPGSDSEILLDPEALLGNQGLEELGIINCRVKDLGTGELADFGLWPDLPG